MKDAILDTLSQYPQVGLSGSFGGFLTSLYVATPLFQFLSALFGALIGLITLLSMLKRKYYERTDKKSVSNS